MTLNKNYYNQKYFYRRDCLNLHMTQTIKLFAQEHSLRHILDVGCGTGKLIQFLTNHGFDVDGCDISSVAVKIARKNNPGSIIKKTSVTNLSCQKKNYDLITAVSLIEHLTKNQARKYLSTSYSCLKTGGFIFLVTPNFNSPLRFLQRKKWFGFKDPSHIKFYTPQSLTHLLLDTGFKNIQTRFSISPNVPFDWPVPKIFNKLPKTVKYLINYLLISSPLSTLRDSFWISGNKM